MPRAVFLLPLLLIACGEATPATVAPTYTAISSEIFVPLCVECHSGSLPEGNLDLSAARGHEELLRTVDGRDWQGTAWEGMSRVAPGSPDESALLATLTRPSGLPSTLHMPEGDALPEAWIESIRTWITNGAKKD